MVIYEEVSAWPTLGLDHKNRETSISISDCTGKRVIGKSKVVVVAERCTHVFFHWYVFYRWQEKSSEKFWCIECTRSSCSKGSGIRIDNCNRKDSRQQFYFDGGRIRSRKNKSMCFERKGRQIKLDSCNNSKSQKVDDHCSVYCLLLVSHSPLVMLFTSYHTTIANVVGWALQN